MYFYMSMIINYDLHFTGIAILYQNKSILSTDNSLFYISVILSIF